MTNPFASLSKHPKRPFREKTFIDRPINEHIPNFDDVIITGSDDELNDLLEDVTARMAQTNILQRESHNRKSYDFSGPKPLSDDYQLISRLLSRIKSLEMSKTYQTKELKAKEMRIKVLQDKLDLYKKVQDIHNTENEKISVLEKRCEEYQQKIAEMEKFLGDYGLIWVGYDVKCDNNQVFDSGKSESPVLESPRDWIITAADYVVDYDRIVRNIRELNQMINAEETQVTLSPDKDRASLQSKSSVPLTLYANGIYFANGPFRDFEDEATRCVIKDLTDGFFPSELESKYPLGVPLKLIDRRNVFYEFPHRTPVFQGPGRTLGGSNEVSKLVVDNRSRANKNNQSKFTQSYDQITDEHGNEMTVEQFLNKLPSSTISHSGRIVTVRRNIAELLEGATSTDQVATVTTKAERAKSGCSNKDSLPNSTRKVPTPDISSSMGNLSRALIKLRIPDEIHKDKIYQLEIEAQDTIKDLYERFAKLAGMPIKSFVLYRSYPKQLLSYTETNNHTIQQAGLLPNALLLVELI